MEQFINNKERRQFQVISMQQWLPKLEVQAYLELNPKISIGMEGHSMEADFLLRSVRTFPRGTPTPDPHEDKGQKSGPEVLPEG